MHVVFREKAMAKDPSLFGGKEHLHRYGIDTFEWPELQKLHQKVLNPMTIDNQNQNHILGRSGHMTLAAFVDSLSGQQILHDTKRRKKRRRTTSGINTMTHRRAKAHPR